MKRTLFAVTAVVAFVMAAGLLMPPGEKRPDVPIREGLMPVDYDLAAARGSFADAMTYRLLALPSGLEGKTFRIVGEYVTAEDEDGGPLHHGCLIEIPAPCACCTQSGVIEFAPGTNSLPREGSSILLSGRLEMCEMGNERRQLTVPVLVDAVVE